jgi:fatty-acyl-CoA synthase
MSGRQPGHSLRAFDWVGHYAKTTPLRAALSDMATGRTLDWRSFDERVERLAGCLRTAMGLRAGDRVVVHAKGSSSVFELQFACARAGLVFVPTNWRLALPELEQIIDDAEPALLVCDREFDDLAAAMRRRRPSTQQLAIDTASTANDYETALGAPAARYDRASPCLDDLWTLLYTSGTTGLPKGVMLSFRMMIFNAVNFAPLVQLGPRSHALCSLPLFHTGGLNCVPNPCFHAGGHVTVMREFDPSVMLRAMTDRTLGVTHVFGVPATFQFVMNQAEFEDARIDHIVSAGCGGAPAPLPMLEAWAGKGLGLQQAFGMTETGPLVSILEAAHATRKLGSSGLPALHVETRVVDESGRDVDVDQVGELWIRGPAVTSGYWNKPDATREAFTEDGWFRSGDAVRVDEEGYMYVIDRWKDMYISGGENVYPAEIESVVAALPEVLEVSIVGVPDARWGEVGHAVVALRPGASLDPEAIMARCRERVASFKVPRHVSFVEALPRNGVGKVLKRELRKRLGEGAGR